MTPDEAVNAMAARLKTADWSRRGDRTWSKAALLKEYFRRTARWAAAYAIDSPEPFFDIGACVASDIRADAAAVTEAVALAKDRGADYIVSSYLVPFMLHWAALQATPGVRFEPHLEDPYEPLLVLFERGGSFHTEKGEVDLEWKSVRISGWRERADAPPIESFDAEFLDEVDRKGSIAQFGYVIEPM